jgi:hypothetical protein
MDPADFRRHGHGKSVVLLPRALGSLSRSITRRPGDIAAALPTGAPEDGEAVR